MLELESTQKDQRPKFTPEQMDSLVIQLYAIFGNLLHVLNQDGFVIFIEGAKDQGKTNIALLLAEICWTLNFRRRIATNILSESFMMERQITDYETLDAWLKSGGRKLFVLDELGKHLKKMRFQTETNLLIMDIVQLIRHYDAGIIGVAPSATFIDGTFLNTDILDATIHKKSRSVAEIEFTRSNEPFTAFHIPSTSIKYNSKDTADFSRRPIVRFEKLQLCCQVAKTYADTQSYDAVMKQFKLSSRRRVGQLLRRHIRHTF